MTTLNPTGYCYHCKQQVLLKREDIDICLVLILAIFTAGIGLIVYLAYYYKKEEVHCVHCGATCSQTFDPSESQIAPQVSNQPQARLFQEQEAVKEEKADINFCPFCGENFNQAGVKFCPNCGSKI
jgi:hypothetical protein